MNYLKEIKPHYNRVQLYNNGNGCPSHEILVELSEIEYRLKQTYKVRMYGSNKVEIYPTDVGCGGCVKSMMQNLERWYNILTKEETVEFKGVPQKESEQLKEIVEDVYNEVIEEEAVRIDQLKWGAFKTYCKEQGLNTKGKKRTELEEELKAL